MNKWSRNDLVIRFTLAGLAAGILLLLVFYLLTFRITGTPFSFGALFNLHGRHFTLFFLDLLPLLFVVLAYLLGMSRARQIGRLEDRIRQETEKNREISGFTQRLIDGDLKKQTGFEYLDPELADALEKLRDSLGRNRELERQRRLEDRKRNWTSQGLAEFGDILRTHTQDLEAMSYAVISALVSYLDANQGAIYIREQENDDEQLRMLACYAYERKKFPGTIIPWGDGLIGAVAMEKMPYYTDKIPDGYLAITSGLGKANPSHLLIQPLVWDEHLYGILELASFTQIDDYKRQFVARVAENIATTIQTMESKLRTEDLLRETQAQAEQMARQEEQMRQNMDALKLTQEEAAKQADIFISFTNTVNHTLLRAEYRTDGSLIYANTRFLRKLGYSGNREVDGRNISTFIDEKDQAWFGQMWTELARGGRHFEGYMKHMTKLGQDLWTMATYTCVRHDDGSVEKILFLAIDSTEYKKQSLDYEGQLAVLDRLNARAVFGPAAKLVLFNDLFRESLKYSKEDLDQMQIFDFFDPREQEQLSAIWERVIRGESYQGQLKLRSKFQEDLWFRSALLAVNDVNGDVEKVIFLANEISKEKEMEIAARIRHEELVRKEEEIRLTSLDLQRKLDESRARNKQMQTEHQKQLDAVRRVLGAYPHPLLTINNQGFLLYMNRAAEKFWKVKSSAFLDKPLSTLLGEDQPSEVVRSFIHPAGHKEEGLYPAQEVLSTSKSPGRFDLLLSASELGKELHYSLLFMPH